MCFEQIAQTSAELDFLAFVQPEQSGSCKPLSASLTNVTDDMFASRGMWQSAQVKHLRCSVCPWTAILSAGEGEQGSPQTMHCFELSSRSVGDMRGASPGGGVGICDKGATVLLSVSSAAGASGAAGCFCPEALDFDSPCPALLANASSSASPFWLLVSLPLQLPISGLLSEEALAVASRIC